MVFVKYEFGSHKEEIQRLLRKRLTARRKVRYHELQLRKHKQSIEGLEEELDLLLGMARGKH